LQIDNKVYNEDREVLMKRLEENGIQTRPVWKLNHEQKPYKDCQYYKVENVKKLVENSLCLPSSSSLSVSQIKMVGKYLK
jgi:dTDP-4-amino-4,6-dideoxygalactose transaminase